MYCVKNALLARNAMKILLLIVGILCFLPYHSHAQKRKRWENSINVSTTISYYPPFEAFEFITPSRLVENDIIQLDYILKDSGTFVITGVESYIEEKTHRTELPLPRINIGASFQLVTESGLYHEAGITRLAFAKSLNLTEWRRTSSGPPITFLEGFEEKAFALALRYELGKYFGGRRRDIPNFRFGIAGGIEPSFYSYSRTPYSSAYFPIEGNIFTLELSLIPLFSVQVSKKVFLEARIVPNILLADFGSIEEKRPDLPDDQRAGLRNYDPPNISTSGGLSIRYMIKEPKRRKRN
jgi:hypothetical protein